MKNRSFLSIGDISSPEFDEILSRIKRIKQDITSRRRLGSLDGVVVGILFEKPSTRTSAGFEVATLRLGGDPLYFSAHDLQLTKGEPVKDTARVLGADLDGIVARVFSHSTLVEFAKYSGISEINGLSDLEHPTQAVSDFSTISEVKGRLKGLKLAYIGDGDSVCNSLMLVATMTGMNFSVACPQGYEPNEKILAESRSKSKSSGSSIEITNDPKKAAAEADVLYTDVWVSIGEESESEKRMKAFTGFQINNELLQQAKQDAVVMHCHPAHRGLEITDDEIEGGRSIVWQQATNKMYGATGILEFFLSSSG
jgi:ornithine carbamoyltransferase